MMPKLWMVVPFVVAACADAEEVGVKGDEPFELTDSGKADGSGLLSAQDQARIEAAFDAAVAASEQTIAKLEAEIVKLEQQHAQKQAEADALVQRIASREQELRDQYDRNLVLCAFFPNPAICIFANYIANDSTLSSYKNQLAAARQQQQQIMQKVADYRARRDVLRAKLVQVRDAKTRMLSLLRNGTTVPVPAELTGAAATAFQRVQVMRKIEDAIASEIALLVEIRNAAVELSNALDQSLATLRALEQSVDALVEQQREAFMDLLSGLLSGDPAAAAEKWLEDVLAAKTRELLGKLSWPASEFARFLVETRAGNNPDPQALLTRILQKLGQQQQVEPLVFTATTPVNILDLTTARSAITVTQSRAIGSLEVYVEIDHTYIGDLVVSLEKDGKAWTLSNNVGGSADSIRKTFRITDVAGVALSGKWTLVVADTVKQDTGKLARWDLVVR